MISRDGHILSATRGIRGYSDGIVAVTLSAHLTALGMSGSEIGTIVTGMLLGSAATSLAVGAVANRFSRRQLLVASSVLAVGTGLVFGSATSFAVLLVAGIIGTINPTSGDVSVFQPIEQALLPNACSVESRGRLFARYTFIGALLAAFGLLSAAVPDRLGLPLTSVFHLYAALGAVALVLYLALSPEVEPHGESTPAPLHESRGVVHRLAALFALDSFAGGFSTHSLVVLWLFRRFHFTLTHAGIVLAGMGVLAAASGFVSVRIERRLGPIRTMVFSHLPAQLFLIAAALMPTPGTAVACLLARSLLASMDVPVRNAYVMSVVTPKERAAAAAITNVPRSLAAALPPFAAGWMLDRTSFGWPLIAAGSLKIVYDLLLLRMFGSSPPTTVTAPNSNAPDEAPR